MRRSAAARDAELDQLPPCARGQVFGDWSGDAPPCGTTNGAAFGQGTW